MAISYRTLLVNSTAMGSKLPGTEGAFVLRLDPSAAKLDPVAHWLSSETTRACVFEPAAVATGARLREADDCYAPCL